MKKDVSRRRFLQKSSIAALGGVLIDRGPLVSEIQPLDQRRSRAEDEPVVACGLIGYGPRGREIASTTNQTERGRIAVVADHFELMLTRASREIPEAERVTDYRAILDNPDIQAVLIATPTHTHKDIVLEALGAGKNVFCEAPLASTIEDARAIATAAAEADGQVFQSGLQLRSHPQYRSVFGFIRSGALGKASMVRSQWRKKTSWRRASATAERERDLNWRLDPATSTGLLGEVGIHQIDTARWFLNEEPTGSSGFGHVAIWDDGRTVADTIQTVVDFPSSVRMVYDLTLTSSFDGMVDQFLGSDSTIMLRDQMAWMFKEVDAPLLGWEVYARKDRFYRETGVALVADATKLEAQGIDPTQENAYPETPLYYALDEFLDNNIYGPYEPSASARVGYEATVISIRLNESVTTGEPVPIAAADLEF
jgi:predicted dehydrogenase